MFCCDGGEVERTFVGVWRLGKGQPLACAWEAADFLIETGRKQRRGRWMSRQKNGVYTQRLETEFVKYKNYIHKT